MKKKQVSSSQVIVRYSSIKFTMLTTLFLIILSGISSCQRSLKEDYTTEEIWLVSDKTEKRIIHELKKKEFECMVITSIIPPRSKPFYIPLKSIRGFDYQVGYQYKIKVLVTHLANPPQDSSNRTFSIKQILSKTKCNS